MLKTPGAHCTGYTSAFFGLVMRIILLLEGRWPGGEEGHGLRSPLVGGLSLQPLTPFSRSSLDLCCIGE
jgi:hypothetical protein